MEMIKMYSFIVFGFIYDAFEYKTNKMYWLHWRYSLIDNFYLYLSLVDVFDKFVIENENGVLALHRKDGFGSFVGSIAIIATANSPPIWRFVANWPRIFRFLAAKYWHYA